MEPLDLTQHPPRSGREELDGMVFLPRTIDKVRATLPGGNPGIYQVTPGMSERVLNALGISEEQLREVVAEAKDDAGVAAWLRANADTSKYAEVSQVIRKRNIDDIQDKEAFYKRYPVLQKNPQIYYLVDLLDADDAEHFRLR